MIKSCVTIALVPEIKTGPWIFWENLEESISKAADLGFDAIELFTSSGSAIKPEILAGLLGKYQLKLAAVGTGAGKVIQGLTLTDSDPEIREKAVSFISEMIAFGALFNAPAIIGSMQGNVVNGVSRNQSFLWLTEGLNKLGNLAGNAGVSLIYEPLNRYETNIINTMEAGVAFIKTLATPHIKLLADLFHMNIEEENISDSLLKYGDYIGHIHFADSNRMPVGLGHTSMSDVAEAIKKIKYDGYLSAEAFPLPNPDAAALQTINAFKQLFSTKTVFPN